MKGGMAIKDSGGNDIVQMARTKRHIHLLEKVQKGKTLSKKELEELKEFESKENKDPSKSNKDRNVVPTIPVLAKELGCSSRTIRNWIGEGMPVRPDKTYDLNAIRNWRTARDNRRKPSQSEELDNAIKKARLRELDVAHKARMGQLIPLDEVEKGRVARILAVKSELLAFPRAMAKVLEHCEARQIEALLKDKINQVIKKFSGQ